MSEDMLNIQTIVGIYSIDTEIIQTISKLFNNGGIK